jgi:hypothetical protein
MALKRPLKNKGIKEEKVTGKSLREQDVPA